MTSFAHRSLLLSLALLTCLPTASAQDAAGSNPGLHLKVDSIHIVRVTEHKVQAELDLSLTAEADAGIEHITFSNLHLNGLPFFAAPVDTPIDLHRGQRASLPPVLVDLYLEDVETVHPLIRVIEEQRAQLMVEIELRVHAGLLTHLLLGSAHPVVVVDVDQPITVAAPEGVKRTSALAVLHAAQLAMDKGLHLPQLNAPDPAWKQQVETTAAKLFLVESCFAVASNRTVNACVHGLAYPTSSTQATTSAELAMPWRFDAVLARAYKRPGPTTPTITVVAMAGATPATPVAVAGITMHGEAPKVRKILYPSRSETTLLDRTAPACFSTLPLPGASLAVLSAQPAQQNPWSQLAVYLAVNLLEGGWQARPVYLSGTAIGPVITFNRPVDKSAIGSPILTPQGVVGVVQSETGGTLLGTPSR